MIQPVSVSKTFIKSTRATFFVVRGQEHGPPNMGGDGAKMTAILIVNCRPVIIMDSMAMRIGGETEIFMETESETVPKSGFIR